MTAHPIGNLDVRLMRTLLILLTECSVSKTADILGQAQPTISLTLKRLREIFDDPLLVRSGNGLVPTERGMELRVAMDEILGRIDTHLAPRSNFNPASSTREFRIVTSNCLGTVFLPPLIGQISSLAPKVSLDVSPMPEHEDMLSGLSDGSIDAVIGNWPRPPQHLRIASILTTDIVCLVRPSHPFTRRTDRIRMDEYLLEKHLSPTSRRHAHLSPIDGRLIELGMTRQISATVPEYAIAPYILASPICCSPRAAILQSRWRKPFHSLFLMRRKSWEKCISICCGMSETTIPPIRSGCVVSSRRWQPACARWMA